MVSEVTTSARTETRSSAIVAVLALVMTTGGLVVYKASSALAVLAKANAQRTLHAKPRWLDVSHAAVAARPMLDSMNYLSWIAIALAFGIVIAATVRAFVPARWLERTVAAEGFRGQIVAALVGAPLMLCSCCVAPVFEGVYARTRRLGPAVGLMLAAPALNPAVLAATFLIFPSAVGWARLFGAIVLVLLAGSVLARVHRDEGASEPCALDLVPTTASGLARAFAESLVTVLRRTLPAILIGVIASMALAGWIPLGPVAGAHPVIAVVLVALVAVPLALPTFGEIPLALALTGAGAPLGVAAALLIAGPAVNLPSLFTLARATSWRVAAAVAASVFIAAVGVGSIVLAIG